MAKKNLFKQMNLAFSQPSLYNSFCKAKKSFKSLKQLFIGCIFPPSERTLNSNGFPHDKRLAKRETNAQMKLTQGDQSFSHASGLKHKSISPKLASNLPCQRERDTEHRGFKAKQSRGKRQKEGKLALKKSWAKITLR